MKVHLLKVWPQQFDELAIGDKTFEYRKNDRDFRVGDTLHLQEYRPDDDAYTGRVTNRLVKHILSEGFGLPEGYVVMSLADYPPANPRPSPWDGMNDQIVDLVIAAREGFDCAFLPAEESNALDKALEPFSSKVRYANEPDEDAAAEDGR